MKSISSCSLYLWTGSVLMFHVIHIEILFSNGICNPLSSTYNGFTGAILLWVKYALSQSLEGKGAMGDPVMETVVGSRCAELHPLVCQNPVIVGLNAGSTMMMSLGLPTPYPCWLVHQGVKHSSSAALLVFLPHQTDFLWYIWNTLQTPSHIRREELSIASLPLYIQSWTLNVHVYMVLSAPDIICTKLWLVLLIAKWIVVCRL